jgi:uncharacterized membrane protein YccC
VPETTADRVHGLLQEIAAFEPQTDHDVGALAEKIAGVTREVAGLQPAARTLDEATAIARIHQELDQLHDALAPFANWRANQAPHHRGGQLVTFKDYATAIRNGVRGMIAVVLGGLFIYATAWTAGPTLLIVLAASCGLLSNAPSAAAASTEFAKGITLSSLLAFVWQFLILPHLTGFPLMFGSLIPVLSVAIYATTVPRYALMSLGFVIFFITQLDLANVMAYDIVAFANGAIALTLGAWLTVLVFRVILPPNPMRDAGNLTRRIRRATEGLIAGTDRRQRPRDRLGWLVTNNQALQRLFQRLQVNPALRSQTIGDSGALLIVAQEALRLRSDLRGLALPETAAAEAGRILKDLTHLRRAQQTADRARQMSETLAALHDQGTEPPPGLLRAAASFRTIAALMPQAERLLALEAPLRKGA